MPQWCFFFRFVFLWWKIYSWFVFISDLIILAEAFVDDCFNIGICFWVPSALFLLFLVWFHSWFCGSFSKDVLVFLFFWLPLIFGINLVRIVPCTVLWDLFQHCWNPPWGILYIKRLHFLCRIQICSQKYWTG